MADFKTGKRFGGGNSRGTFSKGGFRGAPKRDSSRPVERHQATCAHCKKICEVPFRPNGKKPVFCRDCFASGRAGAPARSFSRSDSAPRPSYRSQSTEGQGSDLKSQIDILNTKLDRLIRIVETLEKR